MARLWLASLFSSSLLIILIARVYSGPIESFSYEEGSNSYGLIKPEVVKGPETSQANADLVVYSRQRRSPHFKKWTGYGVGSYHGHHGHGHGYYQPQYQGWHGHQGHGGGPSSSWSNSHSHAQSVSANFGGKEWGAGFSGSAASAGSGSGTQNHYGYYRK